MFVEELLLLYLVLFLLFCICSELETLPVVGHVPVEGGENEVRW